MILPGVPIAELLPLGNRRRVLGQIDVALELEHAWGRIVRCLRVEGDVPDARRRVLGIAVAGRVDEVLLGGCVCADQRNEVVRVDRLCAEQREQCRSRVLLAGKKAGWAGFAVVFAADEGADAWAERAHDGGDVGAELDDVGHGHAVLVVLGIPVLGLVSDGG